MIEQVLQPLAQGRPARYQRYDWDRRELAEWHEADAPFLILEGVSSARIEFRPYLAYRIWAECPRELCLKRGLQRDGAAMFPQWEQWMRAEDDHFREHRTREAADLIVHTYDRAIEVYPAATLVAHRIRSTGYKKRDQTQQRHEIVAALCMKLTIGKSVPDLATSADLVDAAVCVLAGSDFIAGRAMSPENRSLAEREGWIWTAEPKL
jgi:hypothetical protein